MSNPKQEDGKRRTKRNQTNNLSGSRSHKEKADKWKEEKYRRNNIRK